jgi:cell division protease FtsH
VGERRGLLTYTHQRSTYLDTGMGPREREYSEQTAQEIDWEKDRIIDEAHKEVLLKLNDHRHSVQELAGILLEKEPIEGDELKKFAEKLRDEVAAAREQAPADA